MGLGDNMNEVGKIIDRLDIKLQVAGGVRTLDKALRLIGMGAFRVVLGTAAITNLDFLKKAVSVLSPGKIALALDLMNSKVMVEGWKRVERVDASRLIEEANRLSIGALIFTSIEVDGTLKGANLEATKKIVSKLKVPIIVAGGISGLGDLEKLAEIGVDGVIVGKALYEGTINLKEAISRFSR
jgi:phosphoribosylformimino-5-aminoimidazole carboxamide ribotide isomerase